MATERLARTHDRGSFDCGVPALNDFLKRSARQNQDRDLIQTRLVRDDTNPSRIKGFYTLAAGSIRYAEADNELSRGAPTQYDIPIILLARLAVDLEFQRLGIGRALLKNAMLCTLEIADSAGVRALLVDAKDDGARTWYEGFGFAPFNTAPLRLFLLTRKIRESSNS